MHDPTYALGEEGEGHSGGQEEGPMGASSAALREERGLHVDAPAKPRPPLSSPVREGVAGLAALPGAGKRAFPSSSVHPSSLGGEGLEMPGRLVSPMGSGDNLDIGLLMGRTRSTVVSPARGEEGGAAGEHTQHHPNFPLLHGEKEFEDLEAEATATSVEDDDSGSFKRSLIHRALEARRRRSTDVPRDANRAEPTIDDLMVLLVPRLLWQSGFEAGTAELVACGNPRGTTGGSPTAAWWRGT
uniref:Uncharacterized protein n=1 Tax=Hemiselmis andersenii TaxID=464988 RepID=A0A7S0XWM8_HEMAN|mmetsp:Transcript_26849/g.62327  ORF Transcript_26849/g.62327 Transcript_26849/m.62327 type:complete len:243 (+) Transcript_26849:236-964(+)|eukprot:CAMPEP_0172077060 /NCGR_PEP_ID=MMETSP1043-20130122/16855_1 /TAXON_ID=464988 /ORGANISM="Hemiselmis andersenii, Strain CCMP441" /LENGTH=242 /DNA_ID=CAMNT_0012737985 /DNA_START=178 /DNA_END=906 /DNA_ORIENTATION=+